MILVNKIYPIPTLPIDDDYCVSHDNARDDNGYGQYVPATFYHYHRIYGSRPSDVWGQLEEIGLICSSVVYKWKN